MDYSSKEKQKTYERDIENFVSYTNENNEDYKKHKLKLVREKDLNKNKIPIGFFIFLGLALISASLLYGFYYDKININLDCGNETINNDCICPKITCPDNNCNPSFTCKMPDEIEINIVNETG